VVVKRTIALEIAGTKFRLVSDAEQQHLQELAAMINERVEKLSRAGARSASSGQLLALCALELADELRSAQARQREIEQLTRTAVTHAIARIDRHLSEDGRNATKDEPE
jgi:cell division protein ZapA (FtsZ GTPase activity inhibitor)